MRRLVPLAALLLLAGCAGGPGGGSGGSGGLGGLGGRDRPRLAPIAQPTSVIATELAFARAARESGQWAAFRRFAAPGARMQWNGGTATAENWLAGRAEPSVTDRWAPREAWSSCDGSAVVTAGIGTDGAGNWSRFTRVWERQRNGTYRWIYSLSLPDAELTRAQHESERARNEAALADENAILVDAASFIRARVAECSARTQAAPAAEPAPVSTEPGDAAGRSQDGTLRWRWHSSPDGSGHFEALAASDAGWEAVYAEQVAPAGG